MIISPETKERYSRFWNRLDTDRACLFIQSSEHIPAFPEPVSPAQKWGDFTYREKQVLNEVTHADYYAEGFPSVFNNFGPGNLAACISGYYKFADATIWFENDPPFIEDWKKAPEPVTDESSEMFRLVEDYDAMLRSHKDVLVASVPDIGGTYDIIASLRGTENLLYDMYDYPEEMKAFAKKLAPVWKAYYSHYVDRLLKEQGCMTSWQPVWSDLPYYPIQCDYSAMLSPDMFDEFILPDLKQQTEFLSRSIYHLDGPGELPHVDSLLSLPRLNAIQWTNGDGKPPLHDPCWFELYDRIQRAGKGIVLLGPEPEHVEDILRHVSGRGLYMSLYVDNEKQAKEIIHMAEMLMH